jgi:hypothetical protein
MLGCELVKIIECPRDAWQVTAGPSTQQLARARVASLRMTHLEVKNCWGRYE